MRVSHAIYPWMYNVIGEFNPYVHMVNNRSTCVLYSQHTNNIDISILVGGLEHFSIDWEFYHPKWRTPSFFRGIPVYHQPAITGNNISQKCSYGIHGLLIWSLVLSLGGVPCCPGSSPGRRSMCIREVGMETPRTTGESPCFMGKSSIHHG